MIPSIFSDRRVTWLAVGLLIAGAILWMIFAPSMLHAQNIQDTRWGMNKYVRDLVNETDTVKYLPDSTLDRIIHYAHRTTMMALGEATAVDTMVILGIQGQQRYYLNANAIVNRVVAAFRRTETNQGRGDVGMIEVDPSQIGKLGEGVIPNSFAVKANYFLVGTAPLGTDTFFVYYEPLSNALSADSSAVTVASEDVAAVAYLAASQVYLRDHQLQLGQMYFQMWQTLVSLKRPQQVAAPQ